MCFEHGLVILARVRAALVGVMQQAGVWASTLQRHIERFDRDVSIIDGAHGPTHDEPRKQIQDRRQIELAAAADDELRRVPRPSADSDRVPRSSGRADSRRPADRDRSSSST
jgi:hypothetical protein